ncbi:DUF3276 family protein [Marinifilum sp.]|uniref:DUF3276 family protein n=1 Tax=Marinifilum sp. TaxID=2033137 RepID=UPI003BAA093C
MEGYDNKGGYEKKKRNEIFSTAVKAGKRTYFFDVKATRKNDYYLTITESKKRFDKEGNYSYEKHKIFLYKEDFEKFSEGLFDALDFIKSADGESKEVEEIFVTNEENTNSELINGLETEAYSNVEFEDLSE